MYTVRFRPETEQHCRNIDEQREFNVKRKLLFVNRRFIVGTIVLAFLSFAFVEHPTSETSFYDSDIDGLWVGFMPTKADFAFGNLPAVLNMNTTSSSGIGSALLLDAGQNSPEKFNAFTLDGIKIKNTKVAFSMNLKESVGGAETVTFKLKYNSTQGTLSGKFKSKDSTIGSGKVTFHRVYSDNPVTGMWVVDKGGTSAAILVKGKDSIGGTGLVNETFGDLVNGTFASNRLTGTIDDGNFPYDMDLTLGSKKRSLSGNVIDPDDVQIKVNLLPAGTNGKKVKVKKISPDSIDLSSVPPPADVSAEITITGKNFAAGTMVHLDNTALSVESVEVKSAKEIRALIGIPSDIADGTQVALLIVGPDNLQIEKSNAITIKNSGDDDDGGGGGGGETVSFANDVQPIFDANCIGCHGGNGGLFLDSGVSYSNLVNVRANGNPDFFRIAPGDPDNSYLVMKIRGDGRAGNRMPLGGQRLPQSTIDTIVKWVEEGAKDN